MLVSRPLITREKVSANCETSDSAGDIVYITGDQIGAKYQVSKVDIHDREKVPGIGVIVSKSSPTECIVQLYGEVIGVYSGLISGKSYTVNTNSKPVSGPPAASGAETFIQVIGYAVNSDVFFLSPQTNIRGIRS